MPLPLVTAAKRRNACSHRFFRCGSTRCRRSPRAATQACRRKARGWPVGRARSPQSSKGTRSPCRLLLSACALTKIQAESHRACAATSAASQPNPPVRSHPMLLASISETLVNETSHLVRTGGLPMIFVLMAVGSACTPVPSEVVMLFAGFAVADKTGSGAHHHLTLVGVVLAGLIGTMVGSWIAYAVGRGGRLELLERHGGKVHMGPAQIERADRWFQHYGQQIVLFGRLIPLIRAFVSLPAGVARMPVVRFSVLTFIGSIPRVRWLA